MTPTLTLGKTRKKRAGRDEERVRVAFYIRVSTPEQDQEGYSPEFQLEQLHEHVKRKEYKGWYTQSEWHFHDVKSGGNTVERKGLEALMKLVKNKEVDLILVHRFKELQEIRELA